MKKIISILLAVMLVVSVTAVSFGAVSYTPTDSYTVDENTPYAEEAIEACVPGTPTVTIYFQAPENWINKFNTFPGPDDSEPYAHICIYWWGGTGSEWPDGTGIKWCGYQTHLVDKANRIYAAKVPADEGTPVVVWNNGVNGGMDQTAEIFPYAQQIMDANIEGYGPGERDTLPEGAPTYPEWNMDGCIQIINYNIIGDPNDLTGMSWYGSDWYVYYGKGCYGNYPMTSSNYHGRTASCVNPEHEHSAPGDVNNDKAVNIQDVVCLQLYLADHPGLADTTFDINNADVDDDGYVSIIDASRIQRYLAKLCNIDGSTPYKEQ